MECAFLFHRFDAADEAFRQLVKCSREREAGIGRSGVGGVTRVQGIAVLVPMLDGNLRGAVGPQEVQLIADSSFEQGSSRRLGIPGHHDARGNRPGLAYDVQTLWRVISEEMGTEKLQFPMVKRPVGWSQVLNGSRPCHRSTVPWPLRVVQPVRAGHTL